MNSEKFLSEEHQLQTYFSANRQKVDDDIFWLKKMQHDNVLSIEVEFHDYDSLRSLASIAANLEKYVVRQNDFQSFEAMYRGILFAYQTAFMAYGRSIEFDAGSYLTSVIESSTPYDDIIDEVHGYLGDNPAVAELLECYIDELDEGRDYPHLVELAGGMVFMLVERALADRLMHEELASCSVEELGRQSE